MKAIFLQTGSPVDCAVFSRDKICQDYNVFRFVCGICQESIAESFVIVIAIVI